MNTFRSVNEIMAESVRFLKDAVSAWDDFEFQWDLRRSIEKRDAIVYYFANGKWPEPKPIRFRAPHQFNRIAK